MVLCMVGSAVARILLVGKEGTDWWSQIFLPVAAALLYALVTIISGKERFYKTAIPVWLIALYFFFVFSAVDFGYYDAMVSVLYAIVMIFYAFLYTQIISEKSSFTWLLPIVFLVPIGALAYLHRLDILGGREAALFMGKASLARLGYYQGALADCLMTLGLLFTCFAIKRHPLGEYHPTWGDRPDGRRIRTEPPMNQVSPYIMTHRNDANNLFSESVEITELERYVRRKRREGLTGFGMSHVIMAAYVRTVAKYPALNRFIAGQRIYSRGEDIALCMTVKKEMTQEAPDSLVKVHLHPADTAEDVYRKFTAKVEEAKDEMENTSADSTVNAFMMIPGLFLKFTVWLLKTLDYFGLVPRFLLEVSPFHGSVYFTSMGSLGIKPVYHHLYDFGTVPSFCAFGRKRRAEEIKDGEIVERKYVDLKFNLDERICDGFYYAGVIKYFLRLLAHPDVLDKAPEAIEQDIA
jgi:hypothetical protein